MFKKMIPVIMLVFVAACSNVQGNSSHPMANQCECCEHCECKDCHCYNDHKCDCTKGEHCSSCKDSKGKMCHDKAHATPTAHKDGKPCKVCLESEKASGHMQH